VLFAWLGAQRELQRLQMRAELDSLRHYREYFAISRRHFTSEEAWRSTMKEVDAEIAKRRTMLGDVPQ
jgi:hypothetical protein